jgi:uncharacterized protein (DUF1697 family)
MNLKMKDLKRCLESAGYSDVKTVLSSGNVVFGARAGSESTLEKRLEKAMGEELDRPFMTLVRSLDALRELLDADPFARFVLPAGAKRTVTFLRNEPEKKVKLPEEVDGARILGVRGREVLTAYVPSPRGAQFMNVIERTFGKDITTRTWDTVKKVVGDHGA